MNKIYLISLLIVLYLIRASFIPKLNLQDGQEVRVTGRLTEEPQISGNQQKFSLGKFSITTERWPERHYGEEIIITGEIKHQSFDKTQDDPERSRMGQKSKIKDILRQAQDPEQGRGTDEKSKMFFEFFTPEKYLMSYPKIENVGAQRVAPDVNKTTNIDIKKLAIWMRLRIREVFNKIFPRPYDGLAGGIVIGDSSLIDNEFWQKLKSTGVLHIMVASGSNIAMFSEGLLAFFCILFVRKIALLFLISLIWFYTLITGFQPPIIRAAIMATLFYASQFFGRQGETKKIFWVTGMAMLFINPLLLSDIGFQLSFMATGGLVYIQPRLSSRVRPRRNVGNESRDPFLSKGLKKGFLHSLRSVGMTIIRSDNFSSSLSAFLATSPILLLNFGQLNIFSPLVNLLVLWTVPFILQIGMGLGIIGIMGRIGMETAKILSFLLYPLLFYLEKIIEISSGWKIFQISFPKVSVILIVLYYGGLWWWVKKKENVQETKL